MTWCLDSLLPVGAVAGSSLTERIFSAGAALPPLVSLLLIQVLVSEVSRSLDIGSSGDGRMRSTFWAVGVAFPLKVSKMVLSWLGNCMPPGSAGFSLMGV